MQVVLSPSSSLLGSVDKKVTFRIAKIDRKVKRGITERNKARFPAAQILVAVIVTLYSNKPKRAVPMCSWSHDQFLDERFNLLLPALNELVNSH
jgi:hypothetical protein